MNRCTVSCYHCNNKKAKWTKIRLITGLGMLLLAGCAPSPKETLEASKDNLKQAVLEKALDRVLEQKLDMFSQNIDKELEKEFGEKHVKNLTPGFVIYGTSGNRICIKETEIDRSVPWKQNFSPASFRRKYFIMNYKWTIQDIKFSPPKKYSEGDYTQKSTITISVKPSYSMKFSYGMTVHMLTPSNFDTMADYRQQNWETQCEKQLPFGEDDHVIALSAKPHSVHSQQEVAKILYILKMNIDIFDLREDVFFNTQTKQWELKEPAQLKQLRPIPQHHSQDQPPVPQGFKMITLTKDGDSQELLLHARDCEIVEKINSGMIYVNEKWVDRENYLQTQKLSSHLEQCREKSFSWHVMRKLAQSIRENEKADSKTKADAIAVLQYTLQKQIELNCANKKSMESFVLELQHPDFNVIGTEKTAGMIKECQDNINRLEAEEKQRREAQEEETKERIAAEKAEKKAYLTARLNHLKKLKEQVPEKFVNVRSIAKELELFKKEDFAKQYDVLLLLYGLTRKNPRAMQTLIQNNWEVTDYNLRIDCRSCRGRGKASCRACKNSGTCSMCKGTGRRTHYNASLDRDSEIHTTEVSCPQECTYCEGQRKICLSCRGNGGYINRKVLQKAVTTETEKMLELIDLYITRTEEELEQLKK